MKWFTQKKNPLAALQKAYEQKMQDARDAQRAGDIQKTSRLHAEAESLLLQIQTEEAKKSSNPS